MRLDKDGRPGDQLPPAQCCSLLEAHRPVRFLPRESLLGDEPFRRRHRTDAEITMPAAGNGYEAVFVSPVRRHIRRRPAGARSVELSDLAQDNSCASNSGGGLVEEFVDVVGWFEVWVRDIQEADERGQK